jgi:purine nucleoside permease
MAKFLRLLFGLNLLAQSDKPIAVKVVVVAMFERGEDTGDAPGEFGGGDPADVSLGSAVWVEHVIDGDLGYEIDAREIPKDWPTGMVPLRKTRPYEQPLRPELEGEAYTLDQPLVDWAFQLTRSSQILRFGPDGLVDLLEDRCQEFRAGLFAVR